MDFLTSERSVALAAQNHAAPCLVFDAFDVVAKLGDALLLPDNMIISF